MFVTKKIELTADGFRVRYFAPSDPPDVDRYGEYAWSEICAITAFRRLYEPSGKIMNCLEVYEGDSAHEDFVDAPYFDGWDRLAQAINTNVPVAMTSWIERLAEIEPHPLFKQHTEVFPMLLLYQRDQTLPPALDADCEFCDSRIELLK
ncbi:hypothetical protein Pla22_35860 [Rubripirellula amarantea]|uniref:Uncharacterized protein n=1 Tax=Rubripirellula amarantea TaxID=2527999 RepID=A0A5C5WLI4_9BACT|nr:hypothetical protein [Rubripirellula amarantea]TWT50843.1 hypothetical protein Pla22_35860 [Rubripirellula amarantea]